MDEGQKRDKAGGRLRLGATCCVVVSIVQALVSPNQAIRQSYYYVWYGSPVYTGASWWLGGGGSTAAAAAQLVQYKFAHLAVFRLGDVGLLLLFSAS